MNKVKKYDNPGQVICSGEKITRESRKWIGSNLNRSARIFI